MNTNSDISCDVVMDLVAVYKDGLASDDTRRLVRAHLRTCPGCRQLYAGYHAADGARPAACPPPVGNLSNGYSILARHMHKQHMISTATMLSVIGISAAIGVVSALRLITEDEGEGEEKR